MKTAIVSALVVVAFAGTAGAQTLRQYAAKFICGKASTPQVAAYLAANGTYSTAINVHNPRTQSTISYQKKFSIGLPNEKPGPISPWFTGALKPQETMQIDCGDIYGHLGIAPGTFIEGFALIQPLSEFDVVGVYTAEAGTGVSTIAIERVPVRSVQP
jgi:hypothetical protein